jgi:serine/threonine protein kinase
MLADDAPLGDEQRILQLGYLLAASRASDLRTLPFRGITRPGPKTYAFLFEFPSDTQESPPVSLYVLIEPDTAMRDCTSLPTRFHIALSIAKSLAAFHADDWVHKSFRSHSIMFFHSSSGQLTLGKPYLTNFEYSRAVSRDAIWTHDKDPIKNLYRHPDRQRPPSISFNKFHDLWGLGVVLLEIGLWQAAEHIRAEGLLARKLDPTNNPQVLKDIYLKLVQKQLPHTMGPSYAQAVEACLLGKFGCRASDPGLALAVYEEVIQKLDIAMLLSVC